MRLQPTDLRTAGAFFLLLPVRNEPAARRPHRSRLQFTPATPQFVANRWDTPAALPTVLLNDTRPSTSEEPIMIDRIFSALLTFCVLAGGTVAIGSAMADYDRRAAQIVQLPTVTVTGKREAPALAQSEAVEPAAARMQ